MNKFTRKGYGRIYCEYAEDIIRVELVIKSMDEFEFGYMPGDMIAPFSMYPTVVYNGKFDDLDLNDLTARCWDIGVKIWCFNSGFNAYPLSGLVIAPTDQSS